MAKAEIYCFNCSHTALLVEILRRRPSMKADRSDVWPAPLYGRVMENADSVLVHSIVTEFINRREAGQSATEISQWWENVRKQQQQQTTQTQSQSQSQITVTSTQPTITVTVTVHSHQQPQAQAPPQAGAPHGQASPATTATCNNNMRPPGMSQRPPSNGQLPPSTMPPMTQIPQQQQPTQQAQQQHQQQQQSQQQIAPSQSFSQPVAMPDGLNQNDLEAYLLSLRIR